MEKISPKIVEHNYNRYAGCEVVELIVQPDHVHLVLLIPPKLSISDLMGRLKG